MLYSGKSTHLSFWCLLTNRKQKIKNFEASIVVLSNRSNALAKIWKFDKAAAIVQSNLPAQ